MSNPKLNLLIESYDCNQEILNECEGGPKTYRLNGICMQMETLNNNRRVYPSSVVIPEVHRYIKAKLERGNALGELDHPINENIQGRLKDASHKFTLIEQRGNDWYSEAEVLTTPNGMTARGLMEAGVVMGMSSRAVGKTNLQRDGTRVVQSNFRLFSVGDLVTDPSAPDAFMTNLMESKSWVWENGVLVECQEDETKIKAAVNKLARTKQLDQNKLVELFEALTKLRVRRD